MPKTRTDSYLMMDYYLMNVLFDNIIVDCFLQTTVYILQGSTNGRIKSFICMNTCALLKIHAKYMLNSYLKLFVI